jgi:hypothetical protein
MFGPLNTGLQKQKLPNTAERFQEMKTYYEKIKSDDPNCNQSLILSKNVYLM